MLDVYLIDNQVPQVRQKRIQNPTKHLKDGTFWKNSSRPSAVNLFFQKAPS